MGRMLVYSGHQATQDAIPLVGGILKTKMHFRFPIKKHLHKTHALHCNEALPVSSATYFDLKSILSVNKLTFQHTRILETRSYFGLKFA